MSKTEIKICPVCSGNIFTDYIECTDHFESNEKFLIKECSKCKFKITDKVPDENSIGPYYQSENYISHSNTSAGIVNGIYHIAREFMLGQKRKIIVKSLGKKTGLLLDIGAGTGFFAAHMKHHGWEVSGTEKSSEARNFAQKKLNIDLFPAERLFDLKQNQFDAVSLWHVMEHFYDLNKYISEMKRILKQDGILFIALPNHSSFDAKHYKNYWAAYDVPRHIWHFAPVHVQQIFKNAGFTLTKKCRMPLDSFYISMMSEKYKKSKGGLFKGIFYGKISWLISLFNKDRCSSLIYVLKKT